MNINSYLETIALMKLSSGNCYRILLLLMNKAYTQAQMRSILNITDRGNINKYFKELESLSLIEVVKIDGKNKYFRAVLDLNKIANNLPGQTKIDLDK